MRLILHVLNVKAFASGPRWWVEESNGRRGCGKSIAEKGKAKSPSPLMVKAAMALGAGLPFGQVRTMVAGDTEVCQESPPQAKHHPRTLSFPCSVPTLNPSL